MCGVAGSSPWLVGLPPAELGLCVSSFRFCRVGLGWPTPIHGPGEWGQHDPADSGAKLFLKAAPWHHASSVRSVCPAKGGVDSVYTYICFMESCDVGVEAKAGWLVECSPDGAGEPARDH